MKLNTEFCDCCGHVSKRPAIFVRTDQCIQLSTNEKSNIPNAAVFNHLCIKCFEVQYPAAVVQNDDNTSELNPTRVGWKAIGDKDPEPLCVKCNKPKSKHHRVRMGGGFHLAQRPEE